MNELSVVYICLFAKKLNYIYMNIYAYTYCLCSVNIKKVMKINIIYFFRDY